MFGKVGLDEAVQTVNLMVQQGVHVSTSVFYSLLQGCIDKEDLAIGRKIHGLIVRGGFGSNAFLGSHLIRLFALCGNLLEADQIFYNVHKPNIFTWNAIISAHTKLGHGEQAIKLYHQMEASGLKPDAHIFVAVIKACTSILALAQGNLIQSYLFENGFDLDIHVSCALIDMYTKCGNFEDSCKVFSNSPNKNIVSWNALITGYTQHGLNDDAFKLFKEMQLEGMQPNQVTFVSILKACSSIAGITQGKLVHTHIIKSGYESNIIVSNTLIDMYAKCASLKDGRRVFDKLVRPSGVTWNAMIAGYVQQGQDDEALQVFQHMREEGMEANEVTLANAVKACSSISDLDQGKLIHDLIIKSGFECDVFVASTLIKMYTSSGSVEDGCIVFDRLPKQNLVTWTAMIAGYAQNAHGQEAVQLFQQMQEEGVEPNQLTFVSTLKACSSIAAIDLGKLIHIQVIESGFESNVFLASTLIDMYNKCGSIEDACTIFNKLPEENVVTWSSMITGHAQYGQSMEAFKLLNCMEKEGMKPNEVTFVGILNVCSEIAALDQGRLVHAYVTENGFELEILVCNSLIDMYANCGSFYDACRVLHQFPKPGVETWNAIIAGCAQHCNYKLSLQCFEGMLGRAVKPNDVTFVCLLSLCSRLGLVYEGLHLFKSMREEHGIAPTFEHYNCMVDLLGRIGSLFEAEKLLNTMPFLPTILGWICLLSHCRTHGHAELGRRCFDFVIATDSKIAAGFVHMSNIYAHGGMRQYAGKVEEFRNMANAWRKPGKAFIEIGNKVHYFIVRGKNHPQIDDIFVNLQNLGVRMRGGGYMPYLDILVPQCDMAAKNILSAEFVTRKPKYHIF